MKHLYSILTILVFFAVTQCMAQLSVTGGNSAAALVDSLVGQGVTVSNIVYTGSPASKGTYRCTGGCNLGSPSGIFLTSGRANQTPTSPASEHHSEDMAGLGYWELDTIVKPDTTTDAAVLEFDFTAATDSVRFKFIFASEEYNDYVNVFNDVFAFFISGPGITGTKNIALVPGTNTPISIDNVNNGGPFPGVASGPCTNCAYYHDNANGTGGSIFFDGFTVPMYAGIKVMPCQTYHMKFAVADVRDHAFDSGVFLETNSFSSFGQIQLFADGQVQANNDTVLACTGDTIHLSVNPAMNYLWSNGDTTQTITITEANLSASGTYTCAILNPGILCFAYTTTIRVIFVNPNAVITPSGPTTLCPGDSVVLQSNNAHSYLWSNGATTQNITVSNSGSYSVTITDLPSCTSASTPVNVSVASPAASVTGVTSICAGQTTTLSATAGLSYLWSNGSTSQNITPGTSGPYTVTVTFNGGCTASGTANLVINALPVPAITGNNSICQGGTTTLNAGAGFSSYLWSTGATIASISTALSGSYTVTVTNSSGCTASTSRTVTVNPLPVPGITGTSTFCQGNASTLNAGNGFSSYLWTGGVTTQTLPVNSSGNYAVTVTNGFGCSATTSQVVTVHALPVPAISGAAGICAGSTATLSTGTSFSSYLWSTGATTSSISVANANMYTVTVTNANGCSASISKSMVIFALPNPVITGNNTICQGKNSTFDAGAGYTSYLWSTGATSSAISVNTANTFSVTVTDANGCSNNASRVLTVNPAPSTSITGNTAFCQGNSSVLDAGSGFSSYLWSPGGATTRSISTSTGGGYTVTVSNGFGCTSSASATVTVHSLPVPVVNGPSGICTGSSATIAVSSSFTGYQWSNGATVSSLTLTIPGNYAVTVTDANGCSGTTSKTLVTFPLPVPVVTGNAVICPGKTSLLQAGTFSSYLWSTGATSSSINAGAAGSYAVTVTDINTCVDSAFFILTVNALPTPSITGTIAFCNGDSSVLNANSGYTSYHWSTGATASGITVKTPSSYQVTVTDGNGCTATATQPVTVWALPNPVVTGTSAICSGTQSTLTTGNFTSYLWSTGAATQSINVGTTNSYRVTVTDNNGCVKTSLPFALLVRPLPDAVLSNNSIICKGKSTMLNVQLTGTAPFHFSYTDGSITTGPVITNNNTYAINISPAATATYSLTQVLDAYCTGNVSGTAQVIVNPLPQPSITGLAEICDGQSATLDVGAFASYLWSTGETSRTISVDTTAVFSCTVTDGNGCKNNTQHTFTVNETPVISFTNDTSLTCEAPVIHFTNTSAYPAGSVFKWDFADNASSTEENPEHQFSQPGNYPISLTITSSENCTATLTNNLDVIFYPLPVARFTADPKFTSMYDAGINLTSTSDNAVTWKWDLGDGNEATEAALKHYYHEQGKYEIKLIVTNIAGCVSEATDFVIATPFFLPSAFTPNGDGRNETFFEPAFDLDVQSFNLKIWNRWGQLVFASDHYSKGWKGLDSNGNPAPQGVYFYTLNITTLTGKTHDYNGDVTLLR